MLHVADETGTHYVQCWEMDPVDAPPVGEAVSLPVYVRPFASRGGVNYQLVLEQESKAGEVF